MRKATVVDPAVRAAYTAAAFAQRLGLRAGNTWEPPIARNMLAEWMRLGGSEEAWAFVALTAAQRLGLEPFTKGAS